MLAILNSLNANNFPIFQPMLIILVSKFMVHEALFDKTCISLGLLSPFNTYAQLSSGVRGIIFDLKYHLLSNFITASSEGLDKTAQMHMLV